MDVQGVDTAVRSTGLAIVGAFQPTSSERAPDAVLTLVLLGPGGPEMWKAFRSSAEFGDGAPDPLDRWSRKIINLLAMELDASAFYPFGGPPWQPFQRWASSGEGAVISPVAMQASPRRGLWMSYRGALGFKEPLDLSGWAPIGDAGAPCADCIAPCVSACPVDAFRDGAYDTKRCVAYLRSNPSAPCHSGCLVRRACPAGASLQLPTEQCAFHVRAFVAAQP